MVPVRKFCRFAILMILLAGCWSLMLRCTHAENPTAQIKQGEHLFVKDWSQHDPAKDGPAGSDGLGPLFNAVSCVACHSQGGSGGAGANKHNLQLLSLVQLKIDQPVQQAPFDAQRRAVLVTHPNLRQHDSTVLHRASTDEDYHSRVVPLQQNPALSVLGPAAIDPLSQLVNQNLPGARQNQKVIATLRIERNTPTLFGAGLIDAIQPEWLDKTAQDQQRNHPELAGEVAPDHAKFGWRGQIQSLRDFVQAACANELGLQTEGFPQAVDTLSGHTAPVLPDADKKGKSKIVPDMFPTEVTALVR